MTAQLPQRARQTIAGCALVLFAFTANATCGGEPWLTLEVVAGELAGDGLAEFVEIDRDGCVLSQYAAFDTRAGQYMRQLSAAEQSSLATELSESDLLGYDAQAHRAERAAAERLRVTTGTGEIHYVADADWVRLRLRDSSGSVQLVEWPSPQLYAELDPTDARLRRLADFVGRLRAEGDDARRSPISGVVP